MIDVSSHDFTNDVLPPEDVLSQLRAHDERQTAVRHRIAEVKAVYATEWWRWQRGRNPDWDGSIAATDVEVNRIWPFVRSYQAALYPRAMRVSLAPDPMGRGDTTKATLAFNAFQARPDIYDGLKSAVTMALLYPSAGAKVGYKPGRGSPLSRVWLRFIPPWEMVLDIDAGDRADARFIGHRYYRPLREVAREYRIDVKTLKGCPRIDFLASSGQGEGGTNNRRKRENKAADKDAAAFVQVLELCNLVDTVRDPDHPEIVYKGRLEVYILDQGEMSRRPIYMAPLPCATADGEPLPHIEPLILASEPEFPLRGLPQSWRIMPQQREENIYRSYMAAATRKDTRQYEVEMVDGFDADSLTVLTNAVEGGIIKVPAGTGRSIVRKIETGAINPNIVTWIQLVQSDLNAVIGQSPNARGVITKATAFEVQATQLYTDSDFGELATALSRFMARVVRLMGRALVASMQTVGDSAGAYSERPESTALAPVGAIPGTDDPTVDALALQTAGAAAAAASGSVEPFVARTSPLTPQTGVEVAGDGPSATASVEQDVLYLKDRSRVVPVTVDDLDAEFEVSFVEGGRTPLTDQAMQQNLLALLGPFMDLGAKAGLPPEVLARAFMRIIAERFEFPKDLHLEELEEQVRAEAEKAAKKAPPKGRDAPPADAAPEGDTAATIARALQLPPESAIAVLRTLFEGRADALGVLDQIAAIPGEEEQAAALQKVFAPPPPAGQAPPEPQPEA